MAPFALRNSGDFAQLRDSADLDPFHHEDVPGAVETGPVRRYKLTHLEGLARLLPNSFVMPAVTQMRDQPILLV